MFFALIRVSGAYLHVYIHTCMHSYMHAYMYVYMHTCIHACKHAYIHIYMHVCIDCLSFALYQNWNFIKNGGEIYTPPALIKYNWQKNSKLKNFGGPPYPPSNDFDWKGQQIHNIKWKLGKVKKCWIVW